MLPRRARRVVANLIQATGMLGASFRSRIDANVLPGPSMDECESLSHTKWQCKYRVVFILKCRKTLLFRLPPPADLSHLDRGDRVSPYSSLCLAQEARPGR
jgi:hypothetical protein